MSDSGLRDHDLIVTSVPLFHLLLVSDNLSGTVFLVVLDELFTEVNSFFVQVPPLRDLNDLHPIEEATPPVVQRAKGQGQACCHQSDMITMCSQGDFELLFLEDNLMFLKKYSILSLNVSKSFLSKIRSV